MNTIFQTYGEKLCNLLRTEKLIRALAAHCFEGTEIHAAIDQYLPGLENGAPLAAAAIKAEIKSRYSGSIPVDVAVELFLALLENEERHAD